MVKDFDILKQFLMNSTSSSKKKKPSTELIKEIMHLKVLVVEDMRLNQLLMKIILTDFAFEFDIVSDGKQAIEKLF